MSGYNGYRMSNNAVQAYSFGEKPFSKWKKSDIINNINEQLANGVVPGFSMEPSKIPAAVLKKLFLYKSSWHHTGSWYNETDFYSFDEDAVSAVSDSQITEEMEKNEAPNNICYGVVVVQVWSGSRRYHRQTGTDTQAGMVRGEWLYFPNGKYKTTANKVVEFKKFKTFKELTKAFPQFKGAEEKIRKEVGK